MKEKIQNYLSQLTPREILLAKICFTLLCILVAWKLAIDDAIKDILTLHNLKKLLAHSHI